MKKVERDYNLFEEYLKASFVEHMPKTDEELFFMYTGIGLVQFTRKLLETPELITEMTLKEIAKQSSRLEDVIVDRKNELIELYKNCIVEYICQIKNFDGYRSSEFNNWYKKMMQYYEEKKSEWSNKVKEEALIMISTMEKILLKEFFDISN